MVPEVAAIVVKLMSEHPVTIGFLGLGSIGNPMAERLSRGDANLIVYNRTAAKAEAFRGRAEIARTPSEVADRADIILSCVLGSGACRDVVLGPEGIIHGSRVRDYIHVGTSPAELVEDLAAALS